MDGVKLYARSEQEIELLPETVRLLSSDIGIDFGIENVLSFVYVVVRQILL